MKIAIDDLNPDLRLGVQAYSFLAVDRGPGAYAFGDFADIINARYGSPNARAIADAFRAAPDGVLTVNANRTVSVDLTDMRSEAIQQNMLNEVPAPAELEPALARGAQAGAKNDEQDKARLRDFRQEFTDRVIAAIESGDKLPWDKPWHTMQGLPRNAVSGKTYAGGNRVVLGLVAMEKGYTDPRWMTVKQSNDLGGHVRKGEKGVMIERWDNKPFWQRKDVELRLGGRVVKVDAKLGVQDSRVQLVGGQVAHISQIVVRHDSKDYTWKQAERALDLLVGRNYVVFNAEQCEGLKLAPLAPRQDIPAHERGERLMTAMQEDGLRFVHGGSSAYYSPAGDLIALPQRDTFKSVEGYYGTALHEMGHATGAEKRLNRDGITGKHAFGSEGYAKEELRAELFSAFMAAETSIPHDDDQHKAYLQSWANALKNDKNEIFRAAAEAGKAVDYVLAKEQDLLQKIDRIYGQLVGPETADLSKAPHELTFAEFSKVAHAEKLGPGHGRQWEVFYGRDSLGFADGKTIEGAYRQVHEREVNNALYGNQPDSPGFLRKSMPPPQVLAEYPGLQKLWARVIDTRQPDAGVAQQPAPEQGEAKAEHAPEIESAVFWRKVQDAGHIAAIGRDESHVDPVVVDRKLDLTPDEYDGLTADLMANHPAITGAGGTDEQGRRVVVDVNAPGRQRLLIDPQGYDYARYVGIPEQDVDGLLARKSFVIVPEKGSAYDKAIANFVKGGGNEKDARRILDSELAGNYDPKHLPAALVYHGFVKPGQAGDLATAILTEEGQKMLDKEDRKAAELRTGVPAEARSAPTSQRERARAGIER